MTGPHSAVAFEAVDLGDVRKPGAYRFWPPDGTRQGITFGCPCGCGARFGMSFDGWKVTGEWPKVTATPSLGCRDGIGEGFHWHGYLRNGIFEEC